MIAHLCAPGQRSGTGVLQVSRSLDDVVRALGAHDPRLRQAGAQCWRSSRR
jgi:hypothetical protein